MLTLGYSFNPAISLDPVRFKVDGKDPKLTIAPPVAPASGGGGGTTVQPSQSQPPTMDVVTSVVTKPWFVPAVVGAGLLTAFLLLRR